MKIIVAKDYGYCSGVKSAITVVRKIRNQFPLTPIYLTHELVHNYQTNSYIRKTLNVEVISNIDDIKNGIVIFSAHGHKKSDEEKLKSNNVQFYDATCPHLLAVHVEIKKDIMAGKTVIFYGKKTHPECEAILSISDKIIFIDLLDDVFPTNLKNTVFYSQSTIEKNKVDAIKIKLFITYPNVEFKYDLCYSTTNRQNAILNEKDDFDYVFVIGDDSSSNTISLFNLTKSHFISAKHFLISTAKKIPTIDFKIDDRVFITAGASTNKKEIEELVEKLSLIKF